MLFGVFWGHQSHRAICKVTQGDDAAAPCIASSGAQFSNTQLAGDVGLSNSAISHLGCHCVQGMWQVARWYCQQGLMLGTVFREVLEDLQCESLHELAKEIQGNLRRARNPVPPINVKSSISCYQPTLLC